MARTSRKKTPGRKEAQGKEGVDRQANKKRRRDQQEDEPDVSSSSDARGDTIEIGLKDADDCPEHNVKIAFIGLPSAGKSTLINSLVGKRILQTGVCRTTTDVHLIGGENDLGIPDKNFHQETAISDDGVLFSILDLPGMADSENNEEQNFDKLTEAWVTECDIICWVTDIRTAFLTTHEQKEFDKIRTQLRTLSQKTGQLYQVFILLSKYNHDDSHAAGGSSNGGGVRSNNGGQEREACANCTFINPAGTIDCTMCGLPRSSNLPFAARSASEVMEGEIEGDEEGSTIYDCFQRVHRLYAACDNPVPLMKFNAFGRILHHPNAKGSKQLKNLVHKMGVSALDFNTKFCLRWAVADFEYRKQLCRLKNLIGYHMYTIGRSLSSSSDFSVLQTIGSSITLPKIMGYLAAILLTRSQKDLDAWLLHVDIQKGLLYNDTLFNTACLALGNENFSTSVPLEMLDKWIKPQCPEGINSSDLLKFRCFLLYGRQNPLSLRMFFSIDKKFTGPVYHDKKLISGSFAHPLRLSPFRAWIGQDICQFDDDCLGILISSKKWQRRMLQAVTNVWEMSASESEDLDPLAMALLVKAGTISTVFSPSFLHHRGS